MKFPKIPTAITKSHRRARALAALRRHRRPVTIAALLTIVVLAPAINIIYPNQSLS